jgi:hypothetical protein
VASVVESLRSLIGSQYLPGGEEYQELARDLYRQCGDSEVLMSEEAEACFVLPLREAAALGLLQPSLLAQACML